MPWTPIMRETRFVLDSELALHTNWQSALADDHRVLRVEIASTLHYTYTCGATVTSGKIEDDRVLLQFRNYYDWTAKAIGPVEECGTFLGIPVFLNERLGDRMLVLVSEKAPIV